MTTNQDSEASLQKAIGARRLQALAILTDEDTQIFLNANRRKFEVWGAVGASSMTRAERAEVSLVSHCAANPAARIVDCVSMDVAIQEFEDTRAAKRAAK